MNIVAKIKPLVKCEVKTGHKHLTKIPKKFNLVSFYVCVTVSSYLSILEDISKKTLEILRM